MSAINDGGPAFPLDELHQTTGDVYAQHFGMTLRDYFAAKAMQGICASGPGANMSNQRICEEAYDMADAMLKVRKDK